MSLKTEQLRNIAIIAHVDHGKTTLVDEEWVEFTPKSIRLRKTDFGKSARGTSNG
jgi:predicted membrane GTPase involved in stress response